MEVSPTEIPEDQLQELNRWQTQRRALHDRIVDEWGIRDKPPPPAFDEPRAPYIVLAEGKGYALVCRQYVGIAQLGEDGALELPFEFWFYWNPPGATAAVTLELEVHEGELEIVAVRFHRPPHGLELNSQRLRQAANLEELRQKAGAYALAAQARQLDPESLARYEQMLRARREYIPSSDEVAADYREALRFGQPPNIYLAERYGVSRATAARYIRQARDDFKLGPPKKGRGGEASPPRPKGGKR
jgi:hypothetical protein